MLTDIFATPPYFVNEEGTKWWVDKELTQYARKEDKNGVSLNMTCFIIETKVGYRTRVLVSNVVGSTSILEEDQLYEGMAMKIDLRKYLKHDLNISELTPELY